MHLPVRAYYREVLSSIFPTIDSHLRIRPAQRRPRSLIEPHVSFAWTYVTNTTLGKPVMRVRANSEEKTDSIDDDAVKRSPRNVRIHVVCLCQRWETSYFWAKDNPFFQLNSTHLLKDVSICPLFRPVIPGHPVTSIATWTLKIAPFLFSTFFLSFCFFFFFLLLSFYFWTLNVGNLCKLLVVLSWEMRNEKSWALVSSFAQRSNWTVKCWKLIGARRRRSVAY